MVGSNEAGVLRVMSLSISSSAYPTASRAAILAIGNPVALEASAEERDTRGFISISTISPVSGLTANWIFEPPVPTPTAPGANSPHFGRGPADAPARPAKRVGEAYDPRQLELAGAEPAFRVPHPSN